MNRRKEIRRHVAYQLELIDPDLKVVDPSFLSVDVYDDFPCAVVTIEREKSERRDERGYSQTKTTDLKVQIFCEAGSDGSNWLDDFAGRIEYHFAGDTTLCDQVNRCSLAETTIEYGKLGETPIFIGTLRFEISYIAEFETKAPTSDFGGVVPHVR